MSLVVMTCNPTRQRQAQGVIQRGGYDCEMIRELSGCSPRALEALGSSRDLVLLVTDRAGLTAVQALDDALVRYWLVFVEPIPLEWKTALPRKAHASVSLASERGLRRLLDLLDDWRFRQVPRVDFFHFSYRDGAPPTADWVLDTRFLDSPHWVSELRNGLGLESDVAEYVTSQPGAAILLECFVAMLIKLLPFYVGQRRTVLRIGVGCTGGQHRSQAMARALAARVRETGLAQARYIAQPIRDAAPDGPYPPPPGVAEVAGWPTSVDRHTLSLNVGMTQPE